MVAGVAPGILDGLVPGAALRGADEVPPQPGGASRLTVLLALRGARPAGVAHRTVVHTVDRDGELDRLFGGRPGVPAAPTVVVSRPDDPALVPDAGHEAVTLTVTVPSGAQVAEADVERVLDAAERALPGLRDRLLWHEVRTPADIMEATGAEGGAVPAPRSPRRTGGFCTRRTARGRPDCSRPGLGASRWRSAARGHVGRAGGRADRGRTGVPGLSVKGPVGGNGARRETGRCPAAGQ